ncbi:promastigote surface antigen protein 2 PSA2 [Leishmania major strain Friedlin]|uniref:Promastigote surface antigen protein 2 PSA2 n=1 Tax=Leishmania major TaxID=5664 RepID=Q4QGJ4_LEIMA|nr:promastigote surface antigen protein 2 PSA2 [Leishmania major strain Friedlin]CAJ02891.1 promastigote surface antigen protein 2 PSA2 [Leishmania major strain Friedlin]|eukprot:XP_001681704.1 promastigote surface antigen protein 2 PSA2 [Leishmania major strain Friedlin]
MAQCVRRLVLAATLAAAVALLLCTSSAPVARAAGTGDFTAAQRTNTLAVLQAFGRAIPKLGEKWAGNDFCSWEAVLCNAPDVYVSGISPTYAGTLPEMPVNVDYRHVVIRRLDFSEMGPGLSGTLPASWHSMTSLESLSIEKCESISGSVPPEWGSMTSLSVLNLRGTGISGTLPPQWSGMSKARSLQLQDCDLSGSLPSSWSAIPMLASVSLKGNKFCGCVPDSWDQKAGLVVDIEDKHKGSDCLAAKDCATTTTKPSATTATTPNLTNFPPTPRTTTEPLTTTSTEAPAEPTTTTEAPAEPTTTATPTNTPTPAPETECEVDGCEVCEGDSAARCARCREDYFLTDEKTCLKHNDGGVAAVSSGVAAAAVVCVAVLFSVGLAA